MRIFPQNKYRKKTKPRVRYESIISCQYKLTPCFLQFFSYSGVFIWEIKWYRQTLDGIWTYFGNCISFSRISYCSTVKNYTIKSFLTVLNLGFSFTDYSFSNSICSYLIFDIYWVYTAFKKTNNFPFFLRT